MKYKAYFGIKYHEDFGNRCEIEAIITALENGGIQTICMVRDFEKWGDFNFTPKELMKKTFDQIDLCDMVILEMSEKGVGLGIEAGYAAAKVKHMIVLIREGKDVSVTLQGIADEVICYGHPREITGRIISMLKTFHGTN
jgi:hypothetical protein